MDQWQVDGRSKPSAKSQAERKLALHNAARTLDFLRSPLGNLLEALRGDREGLYATRINDQWRICFRWSQGEVEAVEIVDYHDKPKPMIKNRMRPIHPGEILLEEYLALFGMSAHALAMALRVPAPPEPT